MYVIDIRYHTKEKIKVNSGQVGGQVVRQIVKRIVKRLKVLAVRHHIDKKEDCYERNTERE